MAGSVETEAGQVLLCTQPAFTPPARPDRVVERDGGRGMVGEKEG